MELIRLDNVYKTYHVGELDVPVLKGVSLEIKRGELIATVGRSGQQAVSLLHVVAREHLGELDIGAIGECLVVFDEWTDAE